MVPSSGQIVRSETTSAKTGQNAGCGINEISVTDADARLMAVNNNGVDVCYNVQIAVDDLHNLVVDCEVGNNPSDHGQLSKMGKQAKEILEVEQLEVLAEKGYYPAKDLKECDAAGLTTHMAKQRLPGLAEDSEQTNPNMMLNMTYTFAQPVRPCIPEG